LVSRWLAGPSSRIGWPFFWRRRSRLISGRPNRKPKISAVKNAPPARKVM
jgi:hypothetical protein